MYKPLYRTLYKAMTKDKKHPIERLRDMALVTKKKRSTGKAIANAFLEKQTPKKKSKEDKTFWKAPKVTTYKSKYLTNVKNEFTDWCDETRQYELKTNLVMHNNKRYLFRRGKGSIGFIVIHKNGFTTVHLYRDSLTKKNYISTKRFNGKLAWKLVRDIIFKDAIHLVEAKKEDDRPFKTIHKHAIITLEKFKEEFKPNGQMKKSYTSTAKDTALISLGEILKKETAFKFDAGTYPSALSNVLRAINFGKHSYKGARPAVSVYAIWSNYDPESRLINTGLFNTGEPVLYQYEVMRAK